MTWSRAARSELQRVRAARLGPAASALAGVAIGVMAVVGKAGIDTIAGDDTGFIVLIAATVVAAWLGGIIGGLLATVVAIALNGILFLAPAGSLIIASRAAIIKEGLFFLVAIGIVLLVSSWRSSRDRRVEALQEATALTRLLEGRDQRLELALGAGGLGLWEWDLESDTLTWSEAVFGHHGLHPELRPPTFAQYCDILHPDDREAYLGAIDAAVHGSVPFELEYRVRWPDGSLHWIHGSGRVFRDPAGVPVRMMGTGRDVTGRYAVAEQRDRLLADERRTTEFREAFIDVISHELRTPVTTILGATQVLSNPRSTLSAETRSSLLSDVNAESERLHRLVEDLLVLTRVERGRLVVDVEPFDLRRSLGAMIERAAGSRMADVEVEFATALPIVSGESTYIDQIIRNLVGNAVKYTEAGTPIRVDVRSEGQEVAIRVLDEGPGVSKASLPHLFELYYRDPEQARVVSGSGIGLFICANLAEAMGGRTWAARRSGGGSEFGFSLQTLAADEEDRDEG